MVIRNAAIEDDEPEEQGSAEERAARRKIRTFWNACKDYCVECGATNAKDNEDAERFYKGGDGEWETIDKDITGEVRVSVNEFNRDVELITARSNHSDPKIRARESKSKKFRGFAQAISTFGNKAYLEKKVRAQVKKAIKEAIFRNIAFIRIGWDSYRWLPDFEWCSEGAYLDPDCGGDSRRAQYIIEPRTMRLDEVLADDTIEEAIRERLKKKKSTLNLLDSGPKRNPESKERSWDQQPGFQKVKTWHIHSRVGAFPFGSLYGDGAGTGVETSVRDDDPELKKIKVEPDYGTNRAPKPQRDDIDEKRVYIMLIEGFDEPVKMGPWEMDWFDREDFPYIPVRLKDMPGELYGGSSLFKLLKPLYKAKNWFFSFLMARAKAVARSLLIGDKNAFDEKAKEDLRSGKMFQVVWTERPGVNLTPVDMVSRGTEHLETLDRLDTEHDKTSGLNDVTRGEAGQVEKTASEAQMLQDQTEAAFSVLDESVEEVHAEVARYLIMAVQRYVRGRSDYTPCPTCGVPCEACGGEGCPECYDLGTVQGPGTVPPPEPVGPPAPTPMPMSMEPGAPMDPSALLAPPPEPQPMPCPECQGSGWMEPRSEPLRRGADYWISEELAAQWIDDISPADIRAEIQVSIEQGSTRKDYRERRVGLISSMIERMLPVVQPLMPTAPHVIIPKLLTLVSETIRATEIFGAEEWAFSDEEIAAVVQGAQQQAQMAAQAAQGPPQPGPDEIAAQQQAEQQQAMDVEQQKAALKMQADGESRAHEAAEKDSDRKAKLTVEMRKLEIEEQNAVANRAAAGQEAAARAEGERSKMALEARKQALEEQRFQAETTARETEVDATVATLQQIQQATAEANAAIVAAIERLTQAGQSLSESPRTMVEEITRANQGAAEATAKAIEELKVALAAPKKVIIQREDGPLGRIEGATVTPDNGGGS